MKNINDYTYVLFSRDLGLFFVGYDAVKYSKYIEKAHLFYDFNYALHFLNHDKNLNNFVVLSVSDACRAVLYA